MKKLCLVVVCALAGSWSCARRPLGIRANVCQNGHAGSILFGTLCWNDAPGVEDPKVVILDSEREYRALYRKTTGRNNPEPVDFQSFRLLGLLRGGQATSLMTYELVESRESDGGVWLLFKGDDSGMNEMTSNPATFVTIPSGGFVEIVLTGCKARVDFEPHRTNEYQLFTNYDLKSAECQPIPSLDQDDYNYNEEAHKVFEEVFGKDKQGESKGTGPGS